MIVRGSQADRETGVLFEVRDRLVSADKTTTRSRPSLLLHSFCYDSTSRRGGQVPVILRCLSSRSVLRRVAFCPNVLRGSGCRDLGRDRREDAKLWSSGHSSGAREIAIVTRGWRRDGSCLQLLFRSRCADVPQEQHSRRGSKKREGAHGMTESYIGRLKRAGHGPNGATAHRETGCKNR